MSFKAKLKVAGKEVNVLDLAHALKQEIDATGHPSSITHGGKLTMTIESSGDTAFFEWMSNNFERKDDTITFVKRDSDATLEELSFKEGYLVDYAEKFDLTGDNPVMETFIIDVNFDKQSVKVVIPESANKPENHLTSFEKMELLSNGISKKGLEQLKERTTLDYEKLAKMLATTKATLISKKGDEKFNASLSERILSVADVYSYGYEVFEDEERFNNWMLRPNRALGGKAPFEIMDNQFGREEVRDVIGRIDYGVYS